MNSFTGETKVKKRASNEWSFFDQVRYELLKIEYKWFIYMGRCDDGGLRFFWFIVVPLTSGDSLHKVIYRYETELVWQIGKYYFVIV